MEYKDFVGHMVDCNTFGLEQYSSSDCICRYVVGYNTKGHKSSQSWSKTLQNLTQIGAAAGQSLRSVTYKFMNEMCKSRSMSRDEASYILSGGRLVWNTLQVKKASVNNVTLDELTGETKTTFTWKNFLKSYKER